MFDEGPAHRGSQDGPAYRFNHNSSSSNNNNQYNNYITPQQNRNTHNFRRPLPEPNYAGSQYTTRQFEPDLGLCSGVPDRTRSTSSTSLDHEMNAKPVVAIVYLVASPSTYSTATLGRMTQNIRSRYRHSSGSSLVSESQAQAAGYCRMNKSNSTGNQSHPYGSPLHSYVSSQDLFSSQVQGQRRGSSSGTASPQILLSHSTSARPFAGQNSQPVYYESPIGFDLRAETEQLMNRTQKLLVKGGGGGREKEQNVSDVDEWVI